jgi:hypothetical protein
VIHLTLLSGHVRESPRSEVSDDVIATLAHLLATGTHDVPGFAGYKLQVTIDGSALLATVRGRSNAPLVTVGVAPDEESIAALRGLYGDRMKAVRGAPACVADLHDSAVLDPDALGWIGDLERCIAWAWIEHRRGAS